MQEATPGGHIGVQDASSVCCAGMATPAKCPGILKKYRSPCCPKPRLQTSRTNESSRGILYLGKLSNAFRSALDFVSGTLLTTESNLGVSGEIRRTQLLLPHPPAAHPQGQEPGLDVGGLPILSLLVVWLAGLILAPEPPETLCWGSVSLSLVIVQGFKSRALPGSVP